MKKIAIFGDSIAYGLSDEERGGWVQRLNLYFLKKKNNIRIYNFSVSGDDTEELLNHFERECEMSIPDKIIFAIGINDSHYNSKTKKQNIPVTEFKSNLNNLLDIARKFTNDIVFLGLTPVDETKTKSVLWNRVVSYDNKKVKEYDSIIMKFAKKEKVIFIKLYNVLKKRDLFDGLHPNSFGHEKIFKLLKNI